ncbi:MAG: RNA-binding transcriptional accessory protein [Bacteroidia bacterium]|nr:RNA-binding transcriptional accessory protein [Bacteroidia bacterium]
MYENDFISIIANQLGVQQKQVIATVKLLNEGSTVPFIARYRKELTNVLDEVQIENIRLLNLKFTDLVKRKISIIETIKEQGKLTSLLEKSIQDCWDLNLLEDIYLPYKPKRKTKASIAREKGLEPLAIWLLKENNNSPEIEASRYLKNGVTNEDEALQGARDIIAEMVNEDSKARNTIRNQFEKHAVVYTKVAKGKEIEGIKYQDYFKYDESLNRCPSHRLLAVFRGEEEGFLKLSIEPDEEIAIQRLEYIFIKRNNDSSYQIELAIKDSYKRLLSPSMETEFRNLAKAKADEEAIRVFAENLKQLLLSAPLGSKRILAIDPGFRSGCKVVCLNEEGKLLVDDIIYPHEPQRDVQKAEAKIIYLVEKYNMEAFAIGNGTAGRETEEFIRNITFKTEPQIFMVNENGASIYSASEVAREEFPDKDLTVRGSVSIGRRLADPLAELVKIDAKSIGVGQYQHDVDQNKLKQSLDVVVQSCVNQVGVNLNTASKSLLTYVSGLSAQTAQNIINFRNENGAFTSRNQLKKIPRLGDKAFEQCAAFLRIPNAKNVLDNSAVHPESYVIVEQMAKKNACSVNDLISNEAIRKTIRPENYITETAGLLTINDILKELAKPGRDPRAMIQQFSFANVKKPEDLYQGMILPGIVTNITKFGCFVDIGVKQDGMVHISQLADKFIADPNQVVKLQQQVQVKVLEVDLVRKRIALTMKGF